MYRTILRYDMHTVSYNSQALTIRRYNTKPFTHDTYRVSYDIDNYDLCILLNQEG